MLSFRNRSGMACAERYPFGRDVDHVDDGRAAWRDEHGNGIACLGRPEADTAALIPIGQEVDVSRELFVEVFIQAAAAKDSHQAGPNFLKAPDHGAVPPPAVPRTRPMTDVSRAQLAASAASAFSPARVSE